MDINTFYGNKIQPAIGTQPASSLLKNRPQSGEAAEEFSNVFQTAMNQFNNSQTASETAVRSLLLDDGAQLHDVMIQTTEAQLSLELAIQVRNKCLEAYNEIKNMQF